ncbi:MAG: radical SAM protein, partial [Candidatus Binatia bacterium]
RIAQEERERMRFTLSDLAWCIEEQTGIARAREDWYPAGCLSPFSRLTGALQGREIATLTCHPHCSLGTYLFVDKEKKAYPVTRFVDIPNLLKEMDRLANRARPSLIRSYTKLKVFHSLIKYFHKEKAPKGLNFTKFLQVLDGFMDKKAGRGEAGSHNYRTLMIGGMHFMDAYNYQLERVQRCVVHYSAPNGLIYPFCTYNSGPTYREKIERRFSLPLDLWRQGRRILPPSCEIG